MGWMLGEVVSRLRALLEALHRRFTHEHISMTLQVQNRALVCTVNVLVSWLNILGAG